MATNPPCILLDTNIWLERYLPGRMQQETVNALIDEAFAYDCAVAFPAQSALDVYQRVCREHKLWAHKQGSLTEAMAKAIKRLAWDCVNDMRVLATPIPVDTSDFYLACKHRDIHDDLEDDLVIAACQKAHANYLVTLDRKLIAHAPLEAVTPSDMIKLLRAGVAKGADFSAENKDALFNWLRTL